MACRRDRSASPSGMSIQCRGAARIDCDVPRKRTALAAKMHRARRATSRACACAPPRCAHTHPQVTNTALIIIDYQHQGDAQAQQAGNGGIAPLWCGLGAPLRYHGHHGHAAQLSHRRLPRCSHRQLHGAPIKGESYSLELNPPSQIWLCM